MKITNNKGITLIALIVTIIVLIIIASISMATMTGDFALLGKTENAIDNYEKSERNELDAVEDILNRAPKFLVDKVEIGDYVNIGISYTNQMPFADGYTESSIPLSGWRVLSKDGSGAAGIVTLVSAGTPILFYHPNGGYVESSVNNYLKNLNKTITIVSSGTQGFTSNGFSSNNLANVWASNKNINGVTAHALTTDELMVAYNILTAQNGKTINDIYWHTENEYFLKTSVMKATNADMSAKASDLLGIGMEYWLGRFVTF